MKDARCFLWLFCLGSIPFPAQAHLPGPAIGQVVPRAMSMPSGLSHLVGDATARSLLPSAGEEPLLRPGFVQWTYQKGPEPVRGDSMLPGYALEGSQDAVAKEAKFRTAQGEGKAADRIRGGWSPVPSNPRAYPLVSWHF